MVCRLTADQIHLRLHSLLRYLANALRRHLHFMDSENSRNFAFPADDPLVEATNQLSYRLRRAACLARHSFSAGPEQWASMRPEGGQPVVRVAPLQIR